MGDYCRNSEVRTRFSDCLCNVYSHRRTAIKALAREQPIAQALGSMSDNASDSASSSVSTVCDFSALSEVADHEASPLPISVNELLLDVFAERLEQAKRSSRFL